MATNPPPVNEALPAQTPPPIPAGWVPGMPAPPGYYYDIDPSSPGFGQLLPIIGQPGYPSPITVGGVPITPSPGGTSPTSPGGVSSSPGPGGIPSPVPISGSAGGAVSGGVAVQPPVGGQFPIGTNKVVGGEFSGMPALPVDAQGNVRLADGKYVKASDLQQFPESVQREFVLKGFDAGNKAITDYNAKQKQAFEASNVQLADGKWITKESYTSLTPEYQNIAKSQGLEALSNYVKATTIVLPDGTFSLKSYTDLPDSYKTIADSQGLKVAYDKWNADLQDLAKVEARTQFAANNVQLADGKYVANDVWDRLDKKYQDIGMTDGFRAMQEAINIDSTKRAQVVQLADGKYVSSDSFDKLDPKYQDIGMTDGLKQMQLAINHDIQDQQNIIKSIEAYKSGGETVGIQVNPITGETRSGGGTTPVGYNITKYLLDNPDQIENPSKLKSVGFSDDAIKAAQESAKATLDAVKAINNVLSGDKELSGEVSAITEAISNSGFYDPQKLNANLQRVGMTADTQWVDKDTGMMLTPKDIAQRQWDSLTDAQKQTVAGAYSDDPYKGNYFAEQTKILQDVAEKGGLPMQLVTAPFLPIMTPIAKVSTGQKVEPMEWAVAGATGALDIVSLGIGSGAIGTGVKAVIPKAVDIGLTGAAGGVFTKATIDEFKANPNMPVSQKALSIGMDTLIFAGVALGVRGFKATGAEAAAARNAQNVVVKSIDANVVQVPITTRIGDAIGTIKVTIQDIPNRVMTAPEALEYYVKGLGLKAEQVAELAKKGLLETTPEIAQKLAENIKQVGGNVANRVMTMPEAIEYYVGELGVKGNKVIDLAKYGLLEVAPEVARDIAQKIKSGASDLGVKIMSAPEATEYYVTGLGLKVEQVARLAKEGMLEVSKDVADKISDAIKRGGEIAGDISNRVMSAPEAIKYYVEGLGLKAEQVANLAKKGLLEVAPTKAQQIADAVKRGISDIESKVSTIPNAIEYYAEGLALKADEILSLARKDLPSVTMEQAQKILQQVKDEIAKVGRNVINLPDTIAKYTEAAVEVPGKLTGKLADNLNDALTEIRTAIQNKDKEALIRGAQKLEQLSAEVPDESIQKMMADKAKDIQSKADAYIKIGDSVPEKADLAGAIKANAQHVETLNDLLSKTRKIEAKDIGEISKDVTSKEKVIEGITYGETFVDKTAIPITIDTRYAIGQKLVDDLARQYGLKSRKLVEMPEYGKQQTFAGVYNRETGEISLSTHDSRVILHELAHDVTIRQSDEYLDTFIKDNIKGENTAQRLRDWFGLAFSEIANSKYIQRISKADEAENIALYKKYLNDIDTEYHFDIGNLGDKIAKLADDYVDTLNPKFIKDIKETTIGVKYLTPELKAGDLSSLNVKTIGDKIASGTKLSLEEEQFRANYSMMVEDYLKNIAEKSSTVKGVEQTLVKPQEGKLENLTQDIQAKEISDVQIDPKVNRLLDEINQTTESLNRMEQDVANDAIRQQLTQKRDNAVRQLQDVLGKKERTQASTEVDLIKKLKDLGYSDKQIAEMSDRQRVDIVSKDIKPVKIDLGGEPTNFPEKPARVEPWNLTKEQAALDDRIKLGGKMGNDIARVDPDGKVVLSDDYFEHSIADRKQIWLHEMAHFKADAVLKNPDLFWQITDSELFGKYNETLMKWEAGKGFSGRNVNEAITQAIVDYEIDPIGFAKKYPKQTPIIKAISEGREIPKSDLPKTEIGDESATEKPIEKTPEKGGGVATKEKVEVKTETEKKTLTQEELEELLKKKTEEPKPEVKPETKTKTETPIRTDEIITSPSVQGEPYWGVVFEGGKVFVKLITPEVMQQGFISIQTKTGNVLFPQTELNRMTPEQAYRLYTDVNDSPENYVSQQTVVLLNNQPQQRTAPSPQPQPQPQPEPQPSPVPQPTPQPQPEPSPQPTPTPVPGPSPSPVPFPQPQPQPQPQPVQPAQPAPDKTIKGLPFKFKFPEVDQKRKEVKPGTIEWRQGLFWRFVEPPYTENDFHASKWPLPGTYKFAVGEGSARQTLQVLGGSPPEEVKGLDLGWAIINLKRKGRSGEMEVQYAEGADANVATIQERIEKGLPMPNEKWDEHYAQPEGHDEIQPTSELAARRYSEPVTEKIPRVATSNQSPPMGLQKVELPQYRAGKLKVYLVNGQYVRDNIDVNFTQGGHDLVYDYVPRNQIWLDRILDIIDRKATLLHELTEREKMSTGMEYGIAHEQFANPIEKLARQYPVQLDRLIEEKLSVYNPDKPQAEIQPIPVMVVNSEPQPIKRQRKPRVKKEPVEPPPRSLDLGERTYLGHRLTDRVSIA